jgi:hypothetical protein
VADALMPKSKRRQASAEHGGFDRMVHRAISAVGLVRRPRQAQAEVLAGHPTQLSMIEETERDRFYGEPVEE